MKQLLFVFFSINLCLLFSGCYQAQSDDDLRTIPTTNNPNVVPSSGSNMLPKAGF